MSILDEMDRENKRRIGREFAYRRSRAARLGTLEWVVGTAGMELEKGDLSSAVRAALIREGKKIRRRDAWREKVLARRRKARGE